MGSPRCFLKRRRNEVSDQLKIIDSFGRAHTNLRISVTDRCNIRCFYCMPLENVNFLPKSELLTFDEIVRFTRVAAQMGVNRIRLTGGEPLVRRGLCDLIAMLNEIDGIVDIAMTTNGLLLEKHARDLQSAGLNRLNVSLDALDEETFLKIARRDGLQKVLDGLQAAKDVGFSNTKINTVAIAGVNENQVVPMARFCREHQLHLRFIEFMPLDAEENWRKADVLQGEWIRQQISQAIDPLVPVASQEPGQPATDFEYADGIAKVGFINSVSQPFCDTCNRLRITSEGQVRNCLFSTAEWDARQLLRGQSSDEDLAQLILDCVGAKAAGHGSSDLEFVRPQKAMYQIGG